MDMFGILQQILIILMTLIACKSISGYHFPWEKCPCCGKKWKDHDKEKIGG